MIRVSGGDTDPSRGLADGPTDGPTDGPALTVPGRGWRFPLLLAATLVTTGCGAWLMLGILASGGITVLEAVILLLFVPTFGWIALAFWTAVAGFLLQVARRDPLTLRRVPVHPAPSPPSGLPPETGRTAVVMPAHNEDPAHALGGFEAVAASLEATGSAHAFDLHFLSDSTDPEVIRQEASAWAALEARRDGLLPVLHYRRRTENRGRKPGNLAEFCRTRGEAYRYLVVLDADSRMEGSTLVALVRTMEANPEAGLLQTVPLPLDQPTLFGRLVAFASTLYGPMLARGYAFWQGDTANYWGHNAILRLAPFATHARLPVLPGRAPLGGEVLSHDFVEGALLRRAGWRGYLLTELGGSHEGLPGNVVDFGRRDRRWAQGSLQHLRLVGLPGLHFMSRFHFLTGAMGYLASVLWFGLLVAGTAWVVGAEWADSRPLPSGTQGWEAVALTPGGWERVDEGAQSGWRVPAWLLPPARLQVSLLVGTAVLLFLPRGLALLAGWLRGSGAYGGRLRLGVSAFLDTAFTVLMAPVFMWSHTRAVAQILRGRTVEWEAQPREGRAVGWGESLRWGGSAMALGVGWTLLVLAVSPGFVLWLLPILVGLVLAVPLVRITSLAGPWRWAEAWGLLAVPGAPKAPEAVEPPAWGRGEVSLPELDPPGPAGGAPPRPRRETPEVTHV